MTKPPGPLLPYPHLPPEWRSMAASVVACPDASPDDLLMLADALDEAARDSAPAPHAPPAPLIRIEARALAAELRRRAPEYAR